MSIAHSGKMRLTTEVKYLKLPGVNVISGLVGKVGGGINLPLFVNVLFSTN